MTALIFDSVRSSLGILLTLIYPSLKASDIVAFIVCFNTIKFFFL
jgi:hypothetical protein